MLGLHIEAKIRNKAIIHVTVNQAMLQIYYKSERFEHTKK